MSDFEDNTFRILVVDDDPFNLRIVSYALKQNDFAPMTATSGEEALTVINQQGLPHLAIVIFICRRG